LIITYTVNPAFEGITVAPGITLPSGLTIS
jgi:hypothetical protein